MKSPNSISAERAGAAALRRFHEAAQAARQRARLRRARACDRLIVLSACLSLLLLAAIGAHVWCNLDETFAAVCALGVLLVPAFIAAVIMAASLDRSEGGRS